MAISKKNIPVSLFLSRRHLFSRTVEARLPCASLAVGVPPDFSERPVRLFRTY